MEAIYSSRNVKVDDVLTSYSREDEKYIKAEKFSAAILIATRNQRLGIRDYNNRFNNPQSIRDYERLL